MRASMPSSLDPRIAARLRSPHRSPSHRVAAVLGEAWRKAPGSDWRRSCPPTPPVSRLMALDEAATLAALEAARAAFREAIEVGRGRVVYVAGDSVLALFGSTYASCALKFDDAGNETEGFR